MAPIAITPATSWDWQLPEDRADDGTIDPTQTIFQLGALTVEQEAKIEDMATELVIDTDGVSGGRMRRGTVTLQVLEGGLRGWRNFFDSAGNAVEFRTAGGKPPRCAIACLSALSGEQRRQIANAITERQRVTPLERDSSEPSSESPGAGGKTTEATG